MAYPALACNAYYDTTGTYDPFPTSRDVAFSSRLSEDDIGCRPTFTDNSAQSLVHFSSAGSSSSFSKMDSTGKYYAVDQIGEEPASRRGGSFSFGLSRLCRERPEVPTQRSQQSPIGQVQFAVGKTGWWRRQMLIDRSLRFMAALTTLFAVAMIIIVMVYAADFRARGNRNSTSVGSKEPESCKTAEARNIVIHLVINICATCILGMSNTYQQLLTSLNVDELRWVLSKRGDSRVGTNSPFSINAKPKGKLKHWAAWLLLIITSLPVHFVANSLFGPSLYVQPPNIVIYTPVGETEPYQSSRSDLSCWAAFRSGAYHFPRNEEYLEQSGAFGVQATFRSVNITYSEKNCSEYMYNASPNNDFSQEILTKEYYYAEYGIGNCRNGYAVSCELIDQQEDQCRVSVRYQAAIILAVSLTVKAIYMVTVNFRSRMKVKKQCLTFGDVVVASALDPNIQIRNECLVNAGDGYRQQVAHTCHKHCKDPIQSSTGDSIGHCQKCKKYNIIDKAANLVHPVLAIKFKKSLISNLGTTAVVQMILLTFASLCLLGLSLMFAVLMGTAGHTWDSLCRRYMDGTRPDYCDIGRSAYLKQKFGSWGGFNSSVVIASLSQDSLAGEQVSFWISNGAQLIYSLVYLLFIYNITLISMEHEWGKFETTRHRLRCTICQGDVFDQSYLLQLPKKVLFPAMGFSALMHWLLAQSISTRETIWADNAVGVAHSQYEVVTASYPVFVTTTLMIAMTTICWWAFTYKREGFMPQMYGSIRACCSSTTGLHDFTRDGVMWGDLGKGELFRHAGFSSGYAGQIIAAELYAGLEGNGDRGKRD